MSDGEIGTPVNDDNLQKTCPKCFKVNHGDVSACDGCGADLSRVKAEGAGIKKAGLFGFMPVGLPQMQAPRDSKTSDLKDRAKASSVQVVSQANAALEFPDYVIPLKPW